MLAAFCALYLGVIGIAWGALFGLAGFEHCGESDADWGPYLAQGAFSGAAWGAFIGLLAGLAFESIR